MTIVLGSASLSHEEEFRKALIQLQNKKSSWLKITLRLSITQI